MKSFFAALAAVVLGGIILIFIFFGVKESRESDARYQKSMDEAQELIERYRRQ